LCQIQSDYNIIAAILGGSRGVEPVEFAETWSPTSAIDYTRIRIIRLVRCFVVTCGNWTTVVANRLSMNRGVRVFLVIIGTSATSAFSKCISNQERCWRSP
jgi:hypothetical protein